MKMRARVRAVVWIDLDGDVPELNLKDHGRGLTDRPGEEATNEREVLAARRRMAKAAVKIARERFGKDADVLVEEVVER